MSIYRGLSKLSGKPIELDIKTELPIVYVNRPYLPLARHSTQFSFSSWVISGILVQAEETPVKTVQTED